MTTADSILNDGLSAEARRISSLGWSLLIVAPVVACTVAAMLVAAMLPPSYGAQADIMFQLPNEGAVTEEYRATQTVVVTSQAVLGPVSQARNLPVEDVRSALDVSFPLSGAVMRLQFTDASPTIALEMLTAIFDRYNAVLGGIEAIDQGTHRLLVPPFVMDNPVQAGPFQLLAIGLAVGLAISLSAVALIKRPRE